MPTQSEYPSTEANDSTVGTVSWSFASGTVFANDDTYAQVELGSSQISRYLFASNFGFAIPVTATIDGVVVKVGRYARNGVTEAAIRDNSIKLFLAGAPDGEDKLNIIDWPSSETEQTYGTSSDLWFLSPDPADINSTTFGVGVSAAGVGGIISGVGYVDYIVMEVYYTEAADDGANEFQQVATRRRVLSPTPHLYVHVDDTADVVPVPSEDLIDNARALRRQAGPRSRFAIVAPGFPFIADTGSIVEGWWEPQNVGVFGSRRGFSHRPQVSYVLSADLLAGHGECECPPGGAVIVGQGYGVVIVGSNATGEEATTYRAKIISQGYGAAVVVSSCEC